MRIHLISSPRNLSTALMYSFAQREDTRVVDEAFYAYFLPQLDGIDESRGPSLFRAVTEHLETPEIVEVQRCMAETLGFDSLWVSDHVFLDIGKYAQQVVFATKKKTLSVEGAGYAKSGAILSVAGLPVPDFTRLGLGVVLDSDATVSDGGAVVGDLRGLAGRVLRR